MTRVTRLFTVTGLAIVAGLLLWVFSTPDPAPAPVPSQRSYASALHAARAGEPGAARKLYQQLERTDLAPAARAGLFAALPDYPSERALAFARAGLRDASPGVRSAAVQASATLLPAARQAAELGPLLNDPDDSVRNVSALWLLKLDDQQREPYGVRLRRILDAYTHVLEARTGDVDAQVRLATLHLRQGAADQAQAAARAALALHPDNLQARVALAQALDRLGRPDDARATLAEPLRQQPDNAFLQHELGLWLLGHDQAAYALLALTKAVELAPDDATYRMDLAISLHDLDQPEAAQAQLDQLVRRHPSNRKARLLLIDYWKETGQLQNVQILLAELEQQNPDDPALQQGL
jgi:predicted Zn-dependent protease